LRLLIGWRLIDGTQDNIRSCDRMLEFRDFLESLHVPYPLFSAQWSVYAQFLCGIFYIVGLFIRPAALVMIINFLAARYIAHRGQTFHEVFAPLTMLTAAIFFLFYGAGKFSIDNYILKRNKH
jgi:putative oxidoreductase